MLLYPSSQHVNGGGGGRPLRINGIGGARCARDVHDAHDVHGRGGRALHAACAICATYATYATYAACTACTACPARSAYAEEACRAALLRLGGGERAVVRSPDLRYELLGCQLSLLPELLVACFFQTV